MWKDPIVEEVRRVRERHAARYGYDLSAICRALKDEERHSGRRVVSLPPKKRQPWATPGRSKVVRPNRQVKRGGGRQGIVEVVPEAP